MFPTDFEHTNLSENQLNILSEVYVLMRTLSYVTSVRMHRIQNIAVGLQWN